MRTRIQELDAVRGLAALAVVLYHYTTRYQLKVGHTSPPAFTVPFGHYGVELFFLLSGFVIFMTLEHARSAREFMVSRFSRLYPGYWVGMACTLLAMACCGLPYADYTISTRDVLCNVSMLQRYVPGCRNVDGAYWTLSIELTFYGLILGLYLLGKLAQVRSAIVALLAVGLGLHFLTDGGESGPFVLRAARHLALAEFGPYFAAGILFYQLRAGAPKTAPWRDVALLAACLSSIAVLRPWPDLVASVICFAVFALLVAGKLSFLANRPLLFLGAISYSLYVVHQNIGYLVIRHLAAIGIGTHAAIAMAVAASIALATAITFLVERPAQRWLRAVLLRPGRKAPQELALASAKDGA